MLILLDQGKIRNDYLLVVLVSLSFECKIQWFELVLAFVLYLFKIVNYPPGILFKDTLLFFGLIKLYSLFLRLVILCLCIFILEVNALIDHLEAMELFGWTCT